MNIRNPLRYVLDLVKFWPGMELPEEVNANEKLCEVLEKIRGTAAWTKSKYHP